MRDLAGRKKASEGRAARILLGLAAAMMVVYGMNIYMSSGLGSYLLQKAGAKRELERPANLQFIELADTSCGKCFNMLNIANFLKRLNVTKVTDEKNMDYTSPYARSLIGKYGIKSVPAMVITGETNKTVATASLEGLWPQLGGRKAGDAIVLEGFLPRVNISDGKVEGIVSVAILNDSGCAKCYNPSVHISALQSSEGLGVFIDSQTTYDVSSAEGKGLVSKYNITAVPTILVSPEASVYQFFGSPSSFTRYFSRESNGWYVFRDIGFMKQAGGYFDLAANAFVNSSV